MHELELEAEIAALRGRLAAAEAEGHPPAANLFRRIGAWLGDRLR
jgi:hypothetical protein